MANTLTTGVAKFGKMLIGAGSISGSFSDNMLIETRNDDKTVRINSRSYTATSGDIIGYQSKPNASVTGTATVYGSQISPRFADAVGGGSLIGISASPILKGSSGTLTGDFRCIEAELTDENQAGRTVDGIGTMLRMRHQLATTVTGGVYGIRGEAAGGGTGWSGFANLDEGANFANKHTSAGIALPADVGWIRVKVGDTHYKIALYND